MELKILAAVDDSENAMRAVDHVAKFFNSDCKVTLFSVFHDTATLCDLQSPELSSYFLSQQSSFCTLEEKRRSLIKDALEKAKASLVEAGFDNANIVIKTQIQKRGIARDIVDEAGTGYDIIVMGRRGLSGLKEFFVGSVSQKVLSLAKDMSILMVN
ncbi:Universal stress protein, UspA-like [Desulfonema limicola]|uniref:Universal stress protein, UspA-like n=1 Tax=Desulfonema limicola TaxID=45656 RepID=A0A975BCA1_9BACT|nr:universal stress protein [Desulfonema limicola]QTA82969.1 Universal stress protein, UspA-like [Desulfonema limicola]